ncbi:hypothetical protein [Synechococcus sp. BA-132 BA5]|uniref:hypothetical protein n=1 Tax=Synechococcus sp. BA-132 BA5 TaxID=3110252 RepID=UPI002B1EAAE9|nr:hypothetical protein [Synechococcus sp. BA-132 BA5]
MIAINTGDWYGLSCWALVSRKPTRIVINRMSSRRTPSTLGHAHQHLTLIRQLRSA